MAELADQLLDWLEQECGIRLERATARGSVRAFIDARSAEAGLAPAAWWSRLVQGWPAERQALFDAVTVNYTWFQRDPEQLSELLEAMRREPRARPLRCWVAGCSTGEEAYTVAMLAREADQPLELLATDLNSRNLRFAEEGRYGDWALRALRPALQRFFTREGSGWRVRDDVRRSVRFQPHNLLEPALRPGTGLWDLVLCRNVLIYFPPARAQDVRQRLGQVLEPGGWLVLGASEMTPEPPAGLVMQALGSRPALRRPRAGAEANHPRPPVIASSVISPDAPEPAVTFDVRQQLARGATLVPTQPARALAVLDEVRAADPLSPEAHFCAGLALFLLNDATAASEALRAALTLDPSLWPAAFYAGLALEAVGRPEEARRAFQRVLQGHTSPVPALVQISLGDFEAWRTDIVTLARRKLRR